MRGARDASLAALRATRGLCAQAREAEALENALVSVLEQRMSAAGKEAAAAQETERRIDAMEAEVAALQAAHQGQAEAQRVVTTTKRVPRAARSWAAQPAMAMAAGVAPTTKRPWTASSC